MKHMFNRIHFDPSGTCMSVKTVSSARLALLFLGGGVLFFLGGGR